MHEWVKHSPDAPIQAGVMMIHQGFVPFVQHTYYYADVLAYLKHKKIEIKSICT